MARPLLVNERAALYALLACDFEGVSELRRQARTVTTDGSGLIINVVDPAEPAAPMVATVPVEAPVRDSNGSLVNGLMIFTTEGRLSALEYWWTTEEMPNAFPESEQIGPPIAHL